MQVPGGSFSLAQLLAPMWSLEVHFFQQIFHSSLGVDLCHCFKGNLRVSTLQSARSHHSAKYSLPDEMGNQRPLCSGSVVQTSNVTFQVEMHFELLLCNWDFAIFLLDWACGPRITVTSTVSISPNKHVLASSVSSHFLEDLLNEASASGDMQQTCRKASCGRCP